MRKIKKLYDVVIYEIATGKIDAVVGKGLTLNNARELIADKQLGRIKEGYWIKTVQIRNIKEEMFCEPMPSNTEDKFYLQCRFDSLEEAMAAYNIANLWRKEKTQNQKEH